MKALKLIMVALMLGVAQLMNAAAPSAAEVVRKASAKLKSLPGLQADFSIRHNAGVMDGSILLSGNRFVVVTPEVSTWFDGKTQWAYSSAIGEVNVSEPTAEELAQINPLAIISSVQTGYDCRRLASPQGTDRLEFTPRKGDSDYQKIVITLDSATLLPKAFDITTSDRNVMKITLGSVKECTRPADDRFRFSPALYPGVEIVDLR